jgi:hypothetical protein
MHATFLTSPLLSSTKKPFFLPTSRPPQIPLCVGMSFRSKLFAAAVRPARVAATMHGPWQTAAVRPVTTSAAARVERPFKVLGVQQIAVGGLDKV